MLPRASIVVPCYNEAANLPQLLARFEAVRTPDAAWELILVDNGSVDATAQVLQELITPARAEWVRVERVTPPNVGYGHGIMTGLRAARGDLLAWTHADGQTPPADVVRALTLLEASPANTLVKGRRRGRKPGDALFTFCMTLAALPLLRGAYPDVNGQPKAFRRALLERAKAPPDDLSLDLYFLWLSRRLGWRWETFDVHFGARLHGESKWAFNWRSKLRNILRTVRYMWKLSWSAP
ncbi:MAG: glycosyltransferase family 2 protein [Deltaproteobacteria bacterium]|nr:glycosyltransferase family 2 protein [Deltaproteobacteria bacterium]